MKWKVTYRGGDGSRTTMICDADDRPSLISSLAHKGISPILIEKAHGSPRRGLSARHKLIMLWCVVCLAIVGATIVVLCRSNRTTVVPKEYKKASRIPEVKPAKPRPRPSEEAVEPTASEKPKEVVTNFINNVWHDEKGRPHYKVARVIRPGQNTVINGKPWRPEKPVFHHPSEVELDVVLSRHPGERVFGDVNWGAFNRDLPYALKDKIYILPDDTPDIIKRKQAVREAKKELIEAIKAGEDPAEILQATRDDINRLADIRDNLQVVIAEMRQEGASEAEIEEAVEAANLMLAEYNIDKPIVSPRTMRERGEAAKLRKLQKQKGLIR